ncbi:hypothetical protein [Sorangium sp. So ce145]|uniref:hypothetical protein n=1 Tax=Sorangium sp. So ce145 TaxID=3133285 RepID=UPI003F62F255
MTFDIHRPLTNKQGELDEDVAGEFEALLMQRLADSPEKGPAEGAAGQPPEEPLNAQSIGRLAERVEQSGQCRSKRCGRR